MEVECSSLCPAACGPERLQHFILVPEASLTVAVGLMNYVKMESCCFIRKASEACAEATEETRERLLWPRQVDRQTSMMCCAWVSTAALKRCHFMGPMPELPVAEVAQVQPA